MQLKIKQEKIDKLEVTVKTLNKRIGTEIVDLEDGVSVEDSTSPAPRYVSKVNTLNYQRDLDFGKNMYYITNVRNKNFCTLFMKL